MKVLVVDDERNVRESMVQLLELEGIKAEGALNGLSAKRLLQQNSYDAAVVDLKMPGMDGLALLEWIHSDGPDVPVIMISAHGDIADAVEAMKSGAADYVTKPFSPEELILKLRRITEEHAFRAQLEAGRRLEPVRDNLVGNSSSLAAIRAVIDRAAPTTSTVLITGESGVGKEVVARAVHSASLVASGPFVAVNLGGIPESLAESELFGYEKGAFTGAVKQKTGMFELASHGTLFLDEIGEMSLPLQVKLLRVLQDRRIQRLGSTTTIPIDARLIAATNASLEKKVTSGEFREDLYYRLHIVHIHVPPLRDRPEDIPLLAGHLLEKLARKMGRKIDRIEPDAMKALLHHRWPGNVRELENTLERALIFADPPAIRPQDLGLPAAPTSVRAATAGDEGGSLREIERRAIVEALQRWEGNRTQAAIELGISRRTLFNKIREFMIDVPGSS